MRSDGYADQPRAHAGEEVLQAGIDWVFDRHGIAGPHQHAADQVEGLLAAVGDDQVVAGAGELLRAGFIEEAAAEGLISARGAEL